MLKLEKKILKWRLSELVSLVDTPCSSVFCNGFIWTAIANQNVHRAACIHAQWVFALVTTFCSIQSDCCLGSSKDVLKVSKVSLAHPIFSDKKNVCSLPRLHFQVECTLSTLKYRELLQTEIVFLCKKSDKRLNLQDHSTNFVVKTATGHCKLLFDYNCDLFSHVGCCGRKCFRKTRCFFESYSTRTLAITWFAFYCLLNYFLKTNFEAVIRLLNLFLSNYSYGVYINYCGLNFFCLLTSIKVWLETHYTQLNCSYFIST